MVDRVGITFGVSDQSLKTALNHLMSLWLMSRGQNYITDPLEEKPHVFIGCENWFRAVNPGVVQAD